MALRILDRDAPAVFKLDDSMCEVATHRNWANAVVARASRFGTHAVSAGATDEAPAMSAAGWAEGDCRINGSAFAK